MKQKKHFRIPTRKTLVIGFFVLFFLSTSSVFAESGLTKLSQPNITSSLTTENITVLLNTLKNADEVSKLTAFNSTSTNLTLTPSTSVFHKNSLIFPALNLPVLKINKIDLPLMGASVISVGDCINSDYNYYILQPILGLETATFSFIGNGLVYTGNLTKLAFNNYISKPVPVALYKTVSFVENTDVNFQRMSLRIVLPRIALPQINLPQIAFNNINIPRITLPKISLSRITLPKMAFYMPKITLPKISLPNTSGIASAINANISALTQNISTSISNVFSTCYNNYIALFTPLFNRAIVTPLTVTKTTTPLVSNISPTSSVSSEGATQTDNTTIDCGTTTAPKLDSPNTFENNSVLSCLAKNALSCQNAKGVLTDNFFPTIFEINKTSDSCNFKLSYAGDSPISDVTGKKLSLEYLSCPINIVKGMDDTNPASVKFINPDKTDLGKYGSQLYFYGALGLFIENNMDQSKIQAVGCSGDWINTVIASYNSISK